MSREKIGIIQPGRLGDIIILLPAARYIAQAGYDVYWPICTQYIKMFEEVVDYVKFIPVSDDMSVYVLEAYNALKNLKITNIKDVAFTFDHSKNTSFYFNNGGGLKKQFDVLKYEYMNIPITEKWKLHINRNYQQEDLLFNKLVCSSNYTVVNLKHSCGIVKCDIPINTEQVIHTNQDQSIFYWIKILEKANQLILVDSAMMNLVEQLNLNNFKYLIAKPDRRIPIIKNQWNII